MLVLLDLHEQDFNHFGYILGGARLWNHRRGRPNHCREPAVDCISGAARMVIEGL